MYLVLNKCSKVSLFPFSNKWSPWEMTSGPFLGCFEETYRLYFWQCWSFLPKETWLSLHQEAGSPVSWQRSWNWKRNTFLFVTHHVSADWEFFWLHKLKLWEGAHLFHFKGDCDPYSSNWRQSLPLLHTTVWWLIIVNCMDCSRRPLFPLNQKAHFNGESPSVILTGLFKAAGPWSPKHFSKP